MKKIFDELNDFQIKTPLHISGLKLYPVMFQTNSFDSNIEFIDKSFDRAEIDAFEASPEGVVTQVGVRNNSEKFVMILDGEGISGAKQNRIAQTTIILRPFSETIIPVNCIERGRWSYSAERNFNKSDYSISPKMRDRKAEILKNRENERLQGAIWHEIDELSGKYKTRSVTDGLGEVLDHAGRNNDYHDIYDKLEEQCNGYIVFGTERPFIEIFRNDRSRKHYMKKIIKSWVADVEASQIKHVDPNYLLEKYLNASWFEDNSVGAEKSFKTSDISNGRSYFLNGELIHSYYFF